MISGWFVLLLLEAEWSGGTYFGRRICECALCMEHMLVS